MPRHPPCALHSLSHKHSTKTTKRHKPHPPTQTTPPTKVTGHHRPGRAGSYKRSDNNHQAAHTTRHRCQMLASTIHFSNTPPTNPTPTSTAGSSGEGGLRRTTPPPPHRGGWPDSSGPNSVPGRFSWLRAARFPTSKLAVLRRHDVATPAFVDDSTHRTPPGATHSDGGRAGWCSLERR